MKTKIIIAIALVLILGGFGLAVHGRTGNVPATEAHKNIITLNDKNFQQELKNRVVLVDFWASWCPPCRMMEPVLNNVASESVGFAYVGKVNVDESEALAQRYQIQNIPTTILFKNGKEINRFVGLNTKEFLVQQMKNAK
jgi:thioredoxin 1